MKRLSAIILAAILILSMFACGGSGSDRTTETGNDTTKVSEAEGDYPVIKWVHLCNTQPKDTALIEAAINEISEREIGCHIELIMIEVGSFAQKMNILVSSGGNTVDVMPVSRWASLGTAVANGQVICLDEYMDEMMKYLEGTPIENTLICGKINGKQYGIPRYLDMCAKPNFHFDSEMAARLGVTSGQEVDLDELTDLFRKIRELDAETPIIGTGSSGAGAWAAVTFMDDIDGIGCLENPDSTTIVNYYETETYYEVVRNYEIWAKELNAFMPDALNNTEAGIDYFGAGKAIGFFAGHFDAAMDAVYTKNMTGRECVAITFKGDAPLKTNRFVYGVSSSCKYPEKAALMIALMGGNAAISNLMCNGIEGTHYVVREGIATYPEGITADNVGWCIGMSWATMNSTLSYPFEYPGDYFERMINANETASVSKGFGFTFDSANVVNEFSAIKNVISKYRAALACGAVDDFDVTLMKFNDELKDAGVDTLIQEEQKQFDAWLSTE